MQAFQSVAQRLVVNTGEVIIEHHAADAFVAKTFPGLCRDSAGSTVTSVLTLHRSSAQMPIGNKGAGPYYSIPMSCDVLDSPSVHNKLFLSFSL
jgi:hypothetical protein